MPAKCATNLFLKDKCNVIFSTVICTTINVKNYILTNMGAQLYINSY